MPESRQELINWVNALLDLNITKVEECGKGAVYCQIYDSIFRDVPLAKVKFDANSEYQYLNNLKILQSVFTAHEIPRSVPVQDLARCKFQDNLEFLQWTRRFWLANFPEGDPYDPYLARSSGRTTSRSSSRATGPTASSRASTTRPGSTLTSRINTTKPATSAVATRSTSSSSGSFRPSTTQPTTNTMSRLSGPSAQAIKQYTKQIQELEAEVDRLQDMYYTDQSERDFYYDKLFEIEQCLLTLPPTAEELATNIKKILYATKDGFELPEKQDTQDDDDMF